MAKKAKKGPPLPIEPEELEEVNTALTVTAALWNDLTACVEAEDWLKAKNLLDQIYKETGAVSDWSFDRGRRAYAWLLAAGHNSPDSLAPEVPS